MRLAEYQPATAAAALRWPPIGGPRHGDRRDGKERVALAKAMGAEPG